MAKVKADQKNEDSIQYILKAIRKAKQFYKSNSRVCGLAYYDHATILKKHGKR